MKRFDDPIAPRKRENGKKEWSFAAPSYDNRTSCSIPAGNDYGVGFRTPTGTFKPSSIEKGPVPQKSFCFKPDEIFDSEDKKG